MSSKYAEGTSVPIERSKSEIEQSLARFGADEFMYMVRPKMAVVAFMVRGRQVRFILPLPDSEDREFRTTATGRARKSDSVAPAFEAEVRRRWRSLALIIKAKLESIQSGILDFESEFMPYFVLPGGGTVRDRLLPEIEKIYQTGQVPRLLLGE